MNYELAQKLNQAGFPQELGNDKVNRFMDCSGEYAKGGTRNPTLSELIEACGRDFESLDRGDNQLPWVSCTKAQCYGGVTPEEAVARLWLALNLPPKP